MLDMLFNLSIKEIIFIDILLVFFNLAITLLAKKLVQRKYDKTHSVEDTLYFQHKLMRYTQLFIMMITILINSFMLSPYTDYLGNLGFPVLMGISYLIIFIILIGNSLILFDLNQKLRKTTATRKEQLGMLLKVFLFSVIPFMLLICLMAAVSGRFTDTGAINDALKWSAIALLYLIFSMIMPVFSKYILKAKPFEDSEIRNELTSFVEGAGIKNTRLYLWPMIKNRHANAMVTGLVRKDIVISDYLLDNLQTDEIKAILAHEIGHIKKHHLWIRTVLVMGIFVLLGVMEYLMDTYEYYLSETGVWLSLGLFFLIWFLYIGFLAYFIKRIQERQADAYTINLGIDPQVNIKALYKITRLNRMVMNFGKLYEKL